MTEIRLHQPTPDEVHRARRYLAHHRIFTDSEIITLACYGTIENARLLMRAAGIAVMGLPCRSCRARTLTPVDKQAAALELCPDCYAEAGLENEHSDYGHPEPVAGCPSCPEVTP